MIIPAYEAAATLPGVLRALQAQVAAANREVIVVESTEGADPVGLARDWPWVRFLSLGQRTLPGRARNLGAAVARGDLLAFLDADAIPDASWLDELVHALAPDIELVAGAIVNGTPGDPWGTADYVLEFSEWAPQRTSAIPTRRAPAC